MNKIYPIKKKRGTDLFPKLKYFDYKKAKTSRKNLLVLVFCLLLSVKTFFEDSISMVEPLFIFFF